MEYMCCKRYFISTCIYLAGKISIYWCGNTYETVSINFRIVGCKTKCCEWQGENYHILSNDGWLIGRVGLWQFSHKMWEEFVFKAVEELHFVDIRIIV